MAGASDIAIFGAGSAATLLGGWLADRRAARREAANRTELRRQALEDRRIEFERQGLVEARDALHRLARAVSRLHYLDSKAEAEGSRYRAPRQDPAVEEDLLANRDLALAAATLLDDDLRKLVTGVQQRLNEVSASYSRDQGDERLANVTPRVVTALDELGAAVRRLYANSRARDD